MPQGIPGLRTGPRHNPLNIAFMNGTVQGENVFIPMSAVIGGEERCGFGWNMLMEASERKAPPTSSSRACVMCP